MRRRAGLWSKFWLIQIRSRVAPQAWRLCHTKLQFSLRLHPAAATFVTRCKKKGEQNKEGSSAQRLRVGFPTRRRNDGWMTTTRNTRRANTSPRGGLGRSQLAWLAVRHGTCRKYSGSLIAADADGLRRWHVSTFPRPKRTKVAQIIKSVYISSPSSLSVDLLLHIPSISFFSIVLFVLFFWFNRVDPLDNSLKTAFLLSSCSFLSSFLPSLLSSLPHLHCRSSGDFSVFMQKEFAMVFTWQTQAPPPYPRSVNSESRSSWPQPTEPVLGDWTLLISSSALARESRSPESWCWASHRLRITDDGLSWHAK